MSAFHRFRATEPPVRVTVHIPDHLLSQIERARGDVSRNAWILAACAAYLQQESA